MHKLSQPLASLRFTACLAEVRHTLAEALRHRKARAMARREARAFEQLDERTLRDLGLHRADAGPAGRYGTGDGVATLRHVIHAI